MACHIMIIKMEVTMVKAITKRRTLTPNLTVDTEYKSDINTINRVLNMMSIMFILNHV